MHKHWESYLIFKGLMIDAPMLLAMATLRLSRVKASIFQFSFCIATSCFFFFFQRPDINMINTVYETC